MGKPRLFSFRRCPYALRARMAIDYARCDVETIEVSLKAKPEELLACSPKGTVPVLRLEHEVLEQSLDIMRWALAQHDPDDWLLAGDAAAAEESATLIAANDGPFKGDLDRYKYAVRYPEHPREEYRARGEAFLRALDQRLRDRAYLVADRLTLVDVAVAPFVRQFCFVDEAWFWASDHRGVQGWLRRFLDSELFARAMAK
jgi:glutathione S-transferase